MPATHPPIDLTPLYHLLEQATASLAQLKSVGNHIPNPSLFVYMYVRKEALLSSQIEGTQSSFSDLILFENQQQPSAPLDDVEEVSNYVKALNFGLQRINEGFPLSLRLLREVHAILLSGSRGANKLPGEFRQSQNWIGGTRPGNALFVPPPVEKLTECLGNLELFLHNEELPLLVKIGIAHAQFETIHPFLDGNGRLGRLLITLMLIHGGQLAQPTLYLSLYLKEHRSIYYNLLQEVRAHGAWSNWLEFFLEGVTHSSTQAINATKQINQLFHEDFEKISTMGRARFSCEKALDYLKRLPQISASELSKHLNISTPTARSTLNRLADAGIIQEISGQKRNKTYLYRRYLDTLEEGTEPF